MSLHPIADFADLAAEFHRRIARIVWCTMATVAADGRPWTRVVHPVWEASTGWVASSRHGHKARHLAHEPRVSLTYWDAVQDVVTVQAAASWADDQATRERVWALICDTDPPLGYDPAEFWSGGPGDPAFGALRLAATRVDVTGLAASPAPKLTWRLDGSDHRGTAHHAHSSGS
jgi:general stress protein 26